MDVLAFLTLDIQRPNISAIVYGMQGDRQSRAIRAQLVDGSTQWTPPAGTFFVISYAKPDGTHGIYSQTETGNAAVTVSGSVATIALAEQVLTVAGDVPMTLTMFNTDGERLSAFTWLLIVKPAAFSDAAFMSTDYYNLLTEQITAVLKAQESIIGLTATATTLAAGSAATVTVTGGTGADDPFNFELGIPRGDTGAQGETGAAAEITAQIVEYQSGTSGTTAPTGAWSTTVPAVPAGQYLWTRSTVTFNSGSPVVSYSVSRMGVDGTGSVKTVNNQSPDSSGDILLSSSNIPTPDFSSITAALAAKVNTSDVLTLEEIAASTDLSGKVAAAQAASDLSWLLGDGAGLHNCIYRGKFLGNTVTATRYAAIANGSFKDLYIGDYWTINGINYRIAHFDYYLNTGNTPCNTHHALIIPDTVLYNAAMNTSNTTTGGYKGSEMYTTNLAQAKTTINAAFNGHVLSHRIYITTATYNGRPSAGEWADSTADLMTEQMVYGTGILSPVSDGSNVPVNFRVEKSQVALFQHAPNLITNRVNWWLRDVITATTFARVGYDGNAIYSDASSSLGVRPAFCIHGG